MTKCVRVENADRSSWKVKVFVEEKNVEGEWVRQDMPTGLNYPTAMQTFGIHRHRRLVIEEAS
jgi:hypothetical protein